jgi:hypothetical protein
MYNRLLQKLFMPTGKTSPEYIKFMGWSFVSTALVSVQTAMSTHSMLDVVGDSSYRSFNYIGKDIIGQVGGLYYMTHMGVQSDQKPLKFLWYSNAVQQSSYFIMSATPLVSSDLFLPMAGFSNTLANISFTGYGAINAKCIRHLSINGENTGEIYARITTMNTLASSIGLTVGVAVCMCIPEPEYRTALMPIVGLARVHAFNKAIEDIIKN